MELSSEEVMTILRTIFGKYAIASADTENNYLKFSSFITLLKDTNIID